MDERKAVRKSKMVKMWLKYSYDWARRIGNSPTILTSCETGEYEGGR